MTSQYMLRRTFGIKPAKSFLRQRPAPVEQCSFHLTPVELAVDAVKLLWKLYGQASVQETSARVHAWTRLINLLSAVEFAVELQCELDMTQTASCYAREGVMLARTLYLREW
jgi:hypothetical protein